jgi:sugar phosphate permease
LRKNFFIITLIFCTNLLAYNGLALNTLNFHGSEIINYFLLSAAEIPALLIGWYSIESPLGRRWSITIAILLCGISLCSSMLINQTHKTLITLMSIFGKFGIAASYMIAYQQAAELYPTTLRSQGIGLSSTIAAAVGIGVPYITYLVFL